MTMMTFGYESGDGECQFDHSDRNYRPTTFNRRIANAISSNGEAWLRYFRYEGNRCVVP